MYVAKGVPEEKSADEQTGEGLEKIAALASGHEGSPAGRRGAIWEQKRGCMQLLLYLCLAEGMRSALRRSARVA